jgi:hypothetical protein
VNEIPTAKLVDDVSVKVSVSGEDECPTKVSGKVRVESGNVIESARDDV